MTSQTYNNKAELKNNIKVLDDCYKLLNDQKAEDTVCLDITKFNGYFDYFIITTGSSKIHCRALAKHVREFFAKSGYKELNKPELNSSWIILDFDEFIIHIFTQETREYYQLEKLWAG
jgi:ribosome-associated protein